jgi:hypothetical protein
MLPDTLPVLGNGCGDMLCLRFDANGALSEVVNWWHEGATWLPLGKTLSEALVIDAVRSSGDRFEGEFSIEEIEDSPFLLVAQKYVQHDLAELFSGTDDLNRQILLMKLLQAGIAKDAVSGLICERSLRSGLEEYCIRNGGMQLASKLSIDWPDFQVWLFDTSLIPEAVIRMLTKMTGIAAETLVRQDWETADSLAVQVTQSRNDLAWPFAVAGWAAERSDVKDQAIESYYSGLFAMGSTSYFTDTWSLEKQPTRLKFVCERILTLQDLLSPKMRESGYVSAILDQQLTNADRARAIRQYWFKEADDAGTRGDFTRAYECAYRAGWDFYVFDVVDSVLDRLIESAKAGGTKAWEKLAHHHRRSM